jgi:hypothetical protein
MANDTVARRAPTNSGKRGVARHVFVPKAARTADDTFRAKICSFETSLKETGIAVTVPTLC